MALPQQALTYSDVFDDEDAEPKEAPSIQHIRANSSIMQLKKILGGFGHSRPRGAWEQHIANQSFAPQLPIVVKSVRSLVHSECDSQANQMTAIRVRIYDPYCLSTHTTKLPLY
jgi:hypothetical protein